jgi:DNA-binding MarR family transcriptional regulator
MNQKASHLLGHYITDTARNMHRTLQQNFRKAGYPVTSEQWIVLIWLFDKDGRTQQELCDLTLKDKPSITRILNNLEKGKLIIREAHPVDGRIKTVYLTKECKKMEPFLFEIARQTQATAIKGISKIEIDECQNILQRIAANLR